VCALSGLRTPAFCSAAMTSCSSAVREAICNQLSSLTCVCDAVWHGFGALSMQGKSYMGLETVCEDATSLACAWLCTTHTASALIPTRILSSIHAPLPASSPLSLPHSDAQAGAQAAGDRILRCVAVHTQASTQARAWTNTYARR
jgi:hypothetical protein